MKVLYIFMLGVVSGIWSTISNPMESDQHNNNASAPISIGSPSKKSGISALLRRSKSFRSKSGSESSESSSIAGSLDSASSKDLTPTNKREKAVSKLKKLMSRRSSRLRKSVNPELQDWVVVQDLQEIKNEILENVKTAIPGIMKAGLEIFTGDALSCDAQNLNTTEDPLQCEAEGFIEMLECMKDIINIYRMRTDADFPESYEKTLQHNFAHVGDYDVKEVYPYLGYKDLSTVKSVSCTQIRSSIREKMKTSPEDASLLRQIEYPFRNSRTKEYFDIYLTEGKDALSRLIIPQSEVEPLFYLTTVIIELKEELCHAFKKNDKAKPASNHSNDSSPNNLADTLFSLELDSSPNINEPSLDTTQEKSVTKT